MKHLVIVKGEVGEAILSGKKTIESRFSKVKNPPFGVISSGDLVYIKPVGKDIIGQFRVKKVIFFDKFNLDDIKDLKKQYGEELNIEDNYWEKNKNSYYGTLIFISDSARFITSPIKLPKKNLRGWVVLNS